ncbi:MAG: pyridoxal 5'-phosphate synthase glutaminase subunit PdxT [Candidatus Aenigmatarchaeota archaeon]|nr:MAG: pyridoxal 5'-phosphate synthase glutaminase subunit PdxT [Candidatus Aenigmarchaeota archaeon]
MILGILGVQGDFYAHKKMAEKLGIETLIVRHPEDFGNIDGLIIPGGESTTITKLLFKHKLVEPLREFHREGKPIFGTCTGMILLAKKIDNHSDQFSLGFMDISVKRNAYGRQIDSFEDDIEIPLLGKKPFRTVFIRAPKISRIGKNVESLAKHGPDHILVKEGNVLAGSFHPELTEDTRIHEYFVKMVKRTKP